MHTLTAQLLSGSVETQLRSGDGF